MKLSWKLILVVSLLLALSLAIGGYAVVDKAFETELETVLEKSEEDLCLFAGALQVCVNNIDTKNNTDAEALVTGILVSGSLFNQFDYCVYSEGGWLLARSQEEHEGFHKTADGTGIDTYVIREGKQYYVCSEGLFMFFNKNFLLVKSEDVTDVFDHAKENLNSYRVVMLTIFAVGILVAAGFTFYLTGPLRRVSSAARRFTDGDYRERVTVKSRDELGELADDFNVMADTIEAKIAELSDTAERQKDFTASFAHELKTPLTSVIGYADTLRSRPLGEEQKMEAYQYIFHEGKRLESMSHTLLDLFALERAEPEMKPTPLLRVAEEVKESADYLFNQSGVSLVLRVKPATIYASGELLRLLLFNLADNARKASVKGGEVVIEGERRAEGYYFAVIDHGCGIPPEALTRLTDPFYMVDKSRAREQGGAGLGLALCRRIAELHGAELCFESQVGEGTTVSFLLKGGDRHEG